MNQLAQKLFTIASAGIVVLAVFATALPFFRAQASPVDRREQAFQAAATEFGVPADILKAISYNQSRWENHDGQPSMSGGYGLMHLTSKPAAFDGRGDPARPPRPHPGVEQAYTLDQAAELLKIPKDMLKQNDTHNIRGAAALLSHYAKEDNQGVLPAKLGQWYSAVARFSDMNTSESAEQFADTVYQTVQNGASHITTDGHTLRIAAQPVKPDRSLHNLKLPSRSHHDEGVECPRTITCKWVPARFAQNTPDNPNDYGNYDRANREAGLDINYIVIHDTEGSYQSAIDWYQNPASYVSAHYTIRSSDGEVTQSVKNKDIAWHAGNWYMNTHSIGIEHEGFAAEGAT